MAGRQLRVMKASLLWLLLQALVPAHAADPVDVYRFDSPAEEARYRALIAEFRCPKCLNTNLLGSDAPIAQDLRRTVHRLAIAEGRSDREVRDYLQERYGDFVLYSPPVRPGTYLLWFGPAVLLLVALWALRRTIRLAGAQQVELSSAERDRVKALLEEQQP
ncbi:MAG: cytochrome c-type biogenesis protein [Pseudomonadota bacterium]